MISFLKLNFELLTRADIFRERENLLFVVTANAEIIIKTIEEKKYELITAKGQRTFDGQIPFFLAKIRHPKVSIEKISGSDLIYDISVLANSNREKVFLLGGLEDSNSEAQVKLRLLYPDAFFQGYSPPYAPYPFKEELSDHIKKIIKDFSPQYVFVGFGAGKQEEWISDNFDFLSSLKVKIVVGSGGTFEFVSGKLKRAPKFFQKIGLEGVFRFLVQPEWFRLKRILKSFKIFYYYFIY